MLSISAKIDELSQVSETLRIYTESLMKEVKPEGYDDLIETESNKMELARKKAIFVQSHLCNLIRNRGEEVGLGFSNDFIYSIFVETNSMPEFLSRLGFNYAPLVKTNLESYIDEYLELVSLTK
jgi:hypothetical protein